MEASNAWKNQKGRASRKWILLILLLCLSLPTLTLSESAIEDNTRLIEANPNDAGAYYDRGCAYSVQKEYDEAIADFTRAIELNSNDATYYNERRNASYFQKNTMKPQQITRVLWSWILLTLLLSITGDGFILTRRSTLRLSRTIRELSS